jgi:hypothetical protein
MAIDIDLCRAGGYLLIGPLFQKSIRRLSLQGGSMTEVRKFLAMKKIIIVLVFIFLPVMGISRAEGAEKDKGWLVGLGYGQLNVSEIIVSNNSLYSQSDAFEDDTWHVGILSLGGYFNEGNTQIMLDWMFSKGKDLNDYDAQLVGGGTTDVSVDISHGGIFLGLRQLVKRLYGEAGLGIFWQSRSLSYDPPVSNPGHGNGVEYGAWYLGAGYKITDNILLGARHYRSMGGRIFDADDDDNIGDIDIDATAIHLTFLF